MRNSSSPPRDGLTPLDSDIDEIARRALEEARRRELLERQVDKEEEKRVPPPKSHAASA